MEKNFSLKDHLFNHTKVQKLADEIKSVLPTFDDQAFVRTTVKKFPQLELKQRISWISEQLSLYLPKDYQQAVAVILKALPPPVDESKTDDDFGDFIYAPYSDFVAKYGCTKDNLKCSLSALKELTMRFSAEDAIRYFINAFPEETLVFLMECAQDSHYHVRRLASEGTRPKLPWAQKIDLHHGKTIPLLGTLFCDKTRYVTRSVANHLNDLSKTHPETVLETLAEWKKSKKQPNEEMAYIVKHSLRTLIKQGHHGAIKFLNLKTNPEVELVSFKIANKTVKIGSAVEFEVKLKSKKTEQLLIDYGLHFQAKVKGNTSVKIYKLKQIELKAGESIVIVKKHPLRANMTTRKLYPGKHQIELQINGKKIATKSFDLTS